MFLSYFAEGWHPHLCTINDNNAVEQQIPLVKSRLTHTRNFFHETIEKTRGANERRGFLILSRLSEMQPPVFRPLPQLFRQQLLSPIY